MVKAEAVDYSFSVKHYVIQIVKEIANTVSDIKNCRVQAEIYVKI